MKTIAAFLVSGWSLLAAVAAAEEPGIADQRDFPGSINACGPASVLNFLRFSGPPYREVHGKLLGSTDAVRMRYVVDRYYRSRDSVVYPSLRRWGVHGIATADLLTGVNEMLDEFGVAPLSGRYLDLEEDETAGEHLRRCHSLVKRSLEREVSPILSLRSFLVKHREEQGMEPAWEAAVHHNVVITDVEEEPDSAGFRVSALDPFRGRKIHLYLHREGLHPFRALKGVEPTGEWLDGKPFLLVAGPDLVTLRPAHLEWSDRFLIVANFLMGDF